ncbi:MAG: MBOAT family protein [Treponema sp.]|nr:MBOAT family protein [Treponema sp.]
MSFNSLSFAIFLPVIFALHWALPHRYRVMLLLAASYYFYMSWNPKYVVLILSTTLVSYLAGLAIEKERLKSGSAPKWIAVAATLFCLGILFVFKYLGFFSQTVSAVAGMFSLTIHPVTLKLLLPVGISFYTFQTMSYVFDVYAGKTKAERNFLVYASFISFFPQLVAGPIERTENLLPQIKAEKKFDYALAMYGARQILWGLFKKIAVADVVAVWVDNAYSDLTCCTPFDSCIAIFFFTVQIYCDFSGYSDIAIGTAKLFGIRLMKNFSSPYLATSVREFWNRWHISLSTWFRDYVYIPLGGNRCSRLRTSVNLMITFLLSGLWHGADWTFVLWGGMHGFARVIEKLIPARDKKSLLRKALAWLAVFVFCNLTWGFFRAESVGDALSVIGNALGGIPNIDGYFHTRIGLSPGILLRCLCVIGIVAAYDCLSIKMDVIQTAAHANRFLVIGIEYAVLACIVWALYKGLGANQFVYFQF